MWYCAIYANYTILYQQAQIDELHLLTVCTQISERWKQKKKNRYLIRKWRTLLKWNLSITSKGFNTIQCTKMCSAHWWSTTAQFNVKTHSVCVHCIMHKCLLHYQSIKHNLSLFNGIMENDEQFDKYVGKFSDCWC